MATDRWILLHVKFLSGGILMPKAPKTMGKIPFSRNRVPIGWLRLTTSTPKKLQKHRLPVEDLAAQIKSKESPPPVEGSAEECLRQALSVKLQLPSPPPPRQKREETAWYYGGYHPPPNPR